MYLIFYIVYAALYATAYLPLYLLFTAFFDRARWPKRSAAIHTLILVFGALAVAFFLTYNIQSEWWGNRIQHALGGGVTVYFLCWRIMRDTRITVSRFQLFVFCFLVVTALGVANELAESIGQATTPLIFAPDIFDTWLDLWSNTIGALVAGVLLAPVSIKHRN